MTEYRLFCPAKINLFLEVAAKRPDGYHELATLFAKLKFGDNMTLRLSPSEKTEISISLSGPYAAAVTADEDNLVYKAAARFFNFAGVVARCEIELEKNIPTGAGLGGGSSDAGTLLAELCKIYNIDFKKILPLAAGLGADVPLFLYKEPVLRAAGIGDILTPVSVKNNDFYVVLAFPRVHISTKEIFKRLTLAPEREILTSISNLDKIVNALPIGKTLGYWGRFIFNRLEDFVFPYEKEVRDVKEFMQTRGYSMMSGSGSTVFSLFESRDEAVKSASELKNKGCGVIITQL
ncbi:MAG: 4-(cytidine 5'-diphospho)-2-C-methyl-D-erythritol kinase [Elusimicrobium sp.]|nr:4-(cytidine 5'-diphospho)-2-C-methyl-D-erythritol kinase [Elusimicrobium sp.]